MPLWCRWRRATMARVGVGQGRCGHTGRRTRARLPPGVRKAACQVGSSSCSLLQVRLTFAARLARPLVSYGVAEYLGIKNIRPSLKARDSPFTVDNNAGGGFGEQGERARRPCRAHSQAKRCVVRHTQPVGRAEHSGGSSRPAPALRLARALCSG